MFSESGREHIVDKRIDDKIEGENLVNKYFNRLVAKDIHFQNVDFRYTIFDRCYFRNCVFDSCDFTGCQFLNTNLYGATFEGCKFHYASFENTIVDPEVLDTNCPPYENLKLKFARSLRTNFEQLGNSEGVNKAIQIELDSSEEHLKKAWYSNESYYRKKYKGFDRFKMFLKWLNFKLLDYTWGNGESIPKLLRTTLIVLLAIALYKVFAFKDPSNAQHYISSFTSTPGILFGITDEPVFGNFMMSCITFVRLILVGFFLAIIIKKFDRR